jgi:hypothetical protein
MATDEPLVPISEIEAQAGWAVRADRSVVSDWAHRPAVPASVAAELYERAVAERDTLALERQATVAAAAAKRPPLRQVRDARLDALAENGFRGNP